MNEAQESDRLQARLRQFNLVAVPGVEASLVKARHDWNSPRPMPWWTRVLPVAAAALLAIDLVSTRVINGATTTAPESATVAATAIPTVNLVIAPAPIHGDDSISLASLELHKDLEP